MISFLCGGENLACSNGGVHFHVGGDGPCVGGCDRDDDDSDNGGGAGGGSHSEE